MAAPAQGKTNLDTEHEGEGFYLAQFKTPELAVFSYYVQSEKQALLIDPCYDVYVYQKLAQKRGAKIISILMTHYHADFVAGHTGFDLPVIMGPEAKKQGVKVELQEMKDSASFNLGAVWFRVLHTPGHTLESSCFELIDAKKNPFCLFTGDTLFLGEVGRPDLAVSSHLTSQDLAKKLFHSLEKIKQNVALSIRIYPTHGSGSSCGKNIGDGNFCTLETQLAKNYALKIQDEKQFVDALLTGMAKPPAYYFHDASINQKGEASRFDHMLKQKNIPLSIGEFEKAVKSGCAVIETRHLFEGKTIKGSFYMSENGGLASWMGSMIDPKAEILLICNKQKVEDIIERLLRIGYFNIKGYNNFDLAEWEKQGLPVWQPKFIDVKTLATIQNRTNLDVRNQGEWTKTGVIEGSKLIPHGQVSARIEQVKNLPNIYVNCMSGMRARLASSILAQHNLESTIVNGKFQEMAPAGLKVVPYQ